MELGKKGPKKRSSEYKVFGTVAQAHRLKLCQRVELPPSLKAIFRRPADEDKWDKLEEARLAIARCIQGEKNLVDISDGDVEDILIRPERIDGALEQT